MPEMQDLNIRVALLEDRMRSVADALRGLEPLTIAHELLGQSMKHLQDEVRQCRAELAGLRKDIDDREERSSKERKDYRIAFMTLTGVIAAALIAGIATVWASGGFG